MLTAIIGPRHAPRKKPGVRARRTGSLEGNDEDEDADADGCEASGCFGICDDAGDRRQGVCRERARDRDREKERRTNGWTDRRRAVVMIYT